MVLLLCYFTCNTVVLFSDMKFHCKTENCWRMFTTEAELLNHQCRTVKRKQNRAIEPNKIHQCPQCDKRYADKKSCRSHIRNIHEGVGTYKCLYCGYRTDKRKHFEQHKATHSEKKEFKCTQCNYSAITTQHLTNHVHRHHNSNRTFKCKYKQCGVKKPSQQELYEHIRNEHPMKQHWCDVCPMSFGNPHHLSRHKLTHSGVKPYQCEYCGKGFTQQNSYNTHQLVHSGAKPYSCVVKHLIRRVISKHT